MRSRLRRSVDRPQAHVGDLPGRSRTSIWAMSMDWVGVQSSRPRPNPVEQPHVGGRVDDDSSGVRGAVRNARVCAATAAVPTHDQDLVEGPLFELRQRRRWGEAGEHHDDRGRSPRPSRCVKTPARQSLQGCERGRSAGPAGGESAANTAQAQVVPHLEEGAGQCDRGHDDGS